MFVAALLSEAAVIACFALTDLGFLWFNVIGCALVVGLSLLIDLIRGSPLAPHLPPVEGRGIDS